MAEFGRLALHTWTLDTTPLAEAIAAARAGGFDAMELRRIDFTRCFDQGLSNGAVLDLIRAGGLPVCSLGCEYGWLFAKGEERERLFAVLKETCANARALNCPQIMTAPGPLDGPMAVAIDNLKRGADLIGEAGLTLSIEFNFQHPVINTIARARELVNGAGRKNAGILLDAYHLERTGAGGRGFEDVALEEIAAFQYSDVPASADPPLIERLVPGQGTVRWLEVFSLLKEKGYTGYLSYEAPNPDQWKRPAVDVAREAASATRAMLAKVN